MKIEVYARRGLFGRQWRFRIKAPNGKIVAQGEGYRNRADCVATVQAMRAGMFDAAIVNL